MTHALQRNQVVSMNSVLSFRDLWDDYLGPLVNRNTAAYLETHIKGSFPPQ